MARMKGSTTGPKGIDGSGGTGRPGLGSFTGNKYASLVGGNIPKSFLTNHPGFANALQQSPQAAERVLANNPNLASRLTSLMGGGPGGGTNGPGPGGMPNTQGTISNLGAGVSPQAWAAAGLPSYISNLNPIQGTWSVDANGNPVYNMNFDGVQPAGAVPPPPPGGQGGGGGGPGGGNGGGNQFASLLKNVPPSFLANHPGFAQAYAQSPAAAAQMLANNPGMVTRLTNKEANVAANQNNPNAVNLAGVGPNVLANHPALANAIQAGQNNLAQQMIANNPALLARLQAAAGANAGAGASGAAMPMPAQAGGMGTTMPIAPQRPMAGALGAGPPQMPGQPPPGAPSPAGINPLILQLMQNRNAMPNLGNIASMLPAGGNGYG